MTGKLIIPLHKESEINEILNKKLREVEGREWDDLQKYDWLEKMIKLTEQEAGTAKDKPTTDDILSAKTKKLNKKGSELNNRTNLSKMDQIKLSILNKIVDGRSAKIFSILTKR